MFRAFLNWLERKGRCYVIASPDGKEIYMKRYYILFNGKSDNGNEVRTLPFNLFLHHIVRSDHDRDLHDHPWDFCSLILKGGYIEETPAHANLKETGGWYNGRLYTKKRWYGPGSFNRKKATDAHRLEMGSKEGTWTLFWRAKPQRVWGFHTEQGWQRHDKYLEEREQANNESRKLG